MYKRILVAVDGSENSKRAAEHASIIAGLNPDTHVEVLYVEEIDRSRKDVPLKNESKNVDIHSDGRNILGPVKGAFEKKRIDYEIVTKNGDPGSTIVSFANRGGFDLVIIGSRGHNAFKDMMLGSVSLKVARRVNAPVMIIK